MGGYMRKLFFCLLLFLAPIICSAGNPKPNWNRNFQEALKTARAEGRPLLVDYWADWCVPCRHMDEQLWNTKEILAYQGKFVFVRLNYDTSPAMSSRYGVEGIPSVIFLDPWGNLIGQTSGFDGPQLYEDMMKSIPASFENAEKWGEILTGTPNDPEALSAMGRFYFEAGLFDVSNQYYDHALVGLEDPAKKADIVLAMGWNHLKRSEYKQARDKFQNALQQQALTRKDVALFGLVIADIGLKNQDDARKAFDQLKTEYPDSPAVEQAKRKLEQAAEQQR